MAKQEQILSAAEIEREFKIGDPEIQKSIKNGTLTAWRNGDHGNWQIPRSAAERVFATRRTWLDTHQAGEVLGVSHSTVSALARRGELAIAHQNPGKRSRVYFDPQVVQSFATIYRNRLVPKPVHESKTEMNGDGPDVKTAPVLPLTTTPIRPPLEDQGALRLVSAIDGLSKTVMALANRVGAMDQGLREQHGAVTSLTLEVHKLAGWVETLSK